jgi:hypothetical protein
MELKWVARRARHPMFAVEVTKINLGDEEMMALFLLIYNVTVRFPWRWYDILFELTNNGFLYLHCHVATLLFASNYHPRQATQYPE